MDKVVRNGEVAVLVSPGYGAGWVSWNDEVSPFEPKIVEAICDGAMEEDIRKIAKELYPEAFLGGLDGIEVRWVKEGTTFRITEYDGYESLEILTEIDWHIA